MTRRAAKVTHSEVTRLIKAVTSCGLAVQRVTFDGDRIDVVVGGDLDKLPLSRPESWETLEDYLAWKAQHGDSGG